MDFDNSGPLLVLDVKSKSSATVLQQMIDGTVSAHFPKFTAQEIENNGILHGMYLLVLSVIISVIFTVAFKL